MLEPDPKQDRVARQIVDSAFAVHKAVEKLIAVHEAQLPTYLKLSGFRLGLLINFNVPLVKHGIRRIIRPV